MHVLEELWKYENLKEEEDKLVDCKVEHMTVTVLRRQKEAKKYIFAERLEREKKEKKDERYYYLSAHPNIITFFSSSDNLDV
jgi:hypothetical protein